MEDNHIQVETVIQYYRKEISDNKDQISAVIHNFSDKVSLSVIMFAIDYAKLKNKKEVSFIIDTLNEWIRFDLTTSAKVKSHLGLYASETEISSSTSNNNLNDYNSSIVADIEKEEIIREFKKKIGNRIGIEKELMSLFKELDPKVIKLCIDYCSISKKADLPTFIKTINEWKASGLNTSEKVENFFREGSINLISNSENIVSNTTSDNIHRKTDSKTSKSPINKLASMRASSINSNISENKTVFNEDSFNQIEYYYRKYFNDNDIEISNIRSFCEQIDNSIVFRALVYANSVNKNNYKYLESFIHRLKEKNILTLQELNNYLT